LLSRYPGFYRYRGALKANAPLIEGGDQVSEVAKRAAQPIEPPDHQGVARSELLEDTGQGRSISTGAVDNVLKDAFTAGTVEVIQLQRQVPLFLGDPSIANLHSSGIVSKTHLCVKG
jgi:hypothetical protein